MIYTDGKATICSKGTKIQAFGIEDYAKKPEPEPEATHKNYNLKLVEIAGIKYLGKPTYRQIKRPSDYPGRPGDLFSFQKSRSKIWIVTSIIDVKGAL